MREINRLLPGLAVYAQRRMAVLGMMGFASGLPLVLLGSPLQAWLTDAGASVVTIGLFTLIGLPYSLKFLWAPFLDRFIPPLPGRLRGSRRRGWLAILQVLLWLAIGILGWQGLDPQHMERFAAMALLIAFLSASQDIAVDAYRTDSLTEPEMGAGAAVYVFGYRIAVLVAASLALFLADQLPWPLVYGLMSFLMLIAVATSYFAPEPENCTPPASLTAAVIEPFHAFLERYRRVPLGWIPSGLKPVKVILEHPQALLTLGFVMAYQLADRISGPQTTTFLLKIGFTKTDLGIRIWLIFIATLLGVLVGGWAVNQLGIMSALFWFLLLQGASNLSFMVLALLGANYPAMVAATVVENFCAGTSTAAFLAFLMSLCDRQYTATQYALLSSLVPIGGTLIGSFSGYLVETLNWASFWGSTALGIVPALLLLPLIQSPRQHSTPPSL